jgi:hypothetical protein
VRQAADRRGGQPAAAAGVVGEHASGAVTVSTASWSTLKASGFAVGGGGGGVTVSETVAAAETPADAA